MQRDHDVILFGATGFTGRLVADYLSKTPGAGRWAIAGRSRDKLAALGLGVPIVVADAMDPIAMADVARRTRVVCTTVGPFSKYGSALVAACAEAGTHYCDLTAEVHWMRAMIDQHDATARRTGARIVHACGFDSIPSDLGALLAQDLMIARHGRPAERVTAYYGSMSGGVSGGTLASALAIAEASKDRAVRRVLGDPYGLDPDPRAPMPPAPDERRIRWDPERKTFTMPFVMAASNTRIVRRSHALAGYPWGRDFVYREVQTVKPTPLGLALGVGMTAGMLAFLLAAGNDRLRPLIARRLPQPGEGPSAGTRARGFWKLEVVAASGPERVTYRLEDSADPGYGSTARMLAESALCLAHDPLGSAPGFTTPAVAMGHALAQRLRAAGLTLEEGQRT
ncbi:MAG: saccharopine dehydrogenase NADP-binding domain-containing protein [Deltaproteobacteria bacterium]|nr:saccharopine dehydrogenase NADP-binding domain-containing protein [Deltaproteobacteria bacterium]